MSDASDFYERPILNSPYEEPTRHWELDENRRPTHKILEFRRPADFITPIPRPQKTRRAPTQASLVVDKNIERINDEQREYHKALINEIRAGVRAWRALPRAKWGVTPTTALLLEHWRAYPFEQYRPFFCQLEAVETAIWLTEVAPRSKAKFAKYETYLAAANAEHNAGLPRLALKMATGAGKTSVMAMLIAWQALNAVRGGRGRFSSGFLIVAPGVTIRDRLQILKPNYPGNYYVERNLAPAETLGDLNKAVVVVTNYHAFIPREKLNLLKTTKGVLEGWREKTLRSKETPGEIIKRVAPELARMKNIVVINDEAHHCYRERSGVDPDFEFQDLKRGEKKDARAEAAERGEKARVWFSGLELAASQLGVSKIYDLSATPFFLAGSGYAEGTVFPWVASDFSLMDAIECGIVKLPRVPVADNIPELDVPMYRDLWPHIREDMPAKGGEYNPAKLPTKFIGALESLYGHYKDTFDLWKTEVSVPPCLIIVCANTNASKQVFDYISGYWRKDAKGDEKFHPGKFPLFGNFEEDGTPLARPRTLLIDSSSLEAGDLLDDAFREAAKEEIAAFKREARLRGDKIAVALNRGKDADDAALLREVMNTVGKKGRLGEQIRCVVSVGMLSEGWDASNVTHILGARAFGTQLLCEQIVGRALRRLSYERDQDTGLFAPEYADVLGIPFDVSGQPKIAPPARPKETTLIRAVSPDRDELTIVFPRVDAYRTIPPGVRLGADFGEDSTLVLSPELVGATETINSGIIGETVDLNLKNLDEIRPKTVLMRLTRYLLENHFQDDDGQPKLHLYGQLKKIAWEWMSDYLKCENGTRPGSLLVRELADLACERIVYAVNRYGQRLAGDDKRIVRALLNPYNPAGSTLNVKFPTAKRTLWATDPRKCHINYVVADSSWEREFCRILEKRDNRVLAYVKNHNLGFEVPYRFAGEARAYRPDFIVRIDDGRDDPLNLVVEIKGMRGEEDKQKRLTMETLWIPGVNNLGSFGRWDFVELKSKDNLDADLSSAIARILRGSPVSATDGGLFNG